MARFLIDANLPRWFHLWSGGDFVFAHDFGPGWTDEELWKRARTDSLVIVTKDADFRIRMMVATPPPRVIHVRFGNLKVREFFTIMTARWAEAVISIEHFKLVDLFPDRVLAVS